VIIATDDVALIVATDDAALIVATNDATARGSVRVYALRSRVDHAMTCTSQSALLARMRIVASVVAPVLLVSLAFVVALPIAVGTASCTPSSTGEGEGEGEAGEGEGEEGEGEGDGEEGEGEGEEGEGEGEEGEGEEGEGEEGEGEGEGEEGEGEGEAVGDYGAYDVDGPHTVDILDLPVDDRSFNALVFVPSSATSTTPYPVVSISPGLQQPREAYTSYGRRLASHGIVTVIRDDPGAFTQTPDVRDDIAHIVDVWLRAANDDATHELFGLLDLDRVGLAGHSRGGKASLLAAEGALNGVARAWFGLDPVDATTLADGTVAADGLPTIGMPVAFLFADVASSCSPADTTAAALWPPAVAPAAMITGLGAGHTQLEDADACLLCNLCTPDGTADQLVVIDYGVRYLTAFFARELLDDATVGAEFEGAGAALDADAGLITVESR